jgi:hypothetical protein
MSRGGGRVEFGAGPVRERCARSRSADGIVECARFMPHYATLRTELRTCSVYRRGPRGQPAPATHAAGNPSGSQEGPPGSLAAGLRRRAPQGRHWRQRPPSPPLPGLPGGAAPAGGAAPGDGAAGR